jgi:cell division septum initiation protein DivIVA
MGKEILKSALFGYSKISVCQYIVTMNEEFNAKLMAEAETFCKEHSRLQKKIDDLEAELATHKQNACDVGTVLLEAGQYAKQIRQQAQVEVKQTQEEAAALLEQAQEEAAECLKQAQEEAAALLEQAQAEVAELLWQAQEEADQIRSQAQNETDQILLEVKTTSQVQKQKLALYTSAIGKLREDMAILANQTDDALDTFVEQFLSLRQDFEDSEL